MPKRHSNFPTPRYGLTSHTLGYLDASCEDRNCAASRLEYRVCKRHEYREKAMHSNKLVVINWRLVSQWIRTNNQIEARGAAALSQTTLASSSVYRSSPAATECLFLDDGREVCF